MRTILTNLILHTTSLIAKKKNKLLISHAFISIVNIFIIILLEIFLVIISIPLYVIYGNLCGNNKIRHWVVKIALLIILTIFLIVGILKLIFFTTFPLV